MIGPRLLESEEEAARMGPLEYKNISGGIVDVDSTGRRLVMNWSAMGVEDSDGDVIDFGAYKKTIKEKGPQGADLIYHITDHWASVDKIVGKLQELGEVDNHLRAVSIASKTRHGDDVLQLYLDGIIKQHSVGFIPTRSEDKKSYRLIKEINLFEGSSVLWGANSDTGTVAVGKSLVTLKQCEDELDLLLKAMRNGKYSDETFGLLELRIKQIQKAYQDLIPAPEQSTREQTPEKSTSDSEDMQKEIVSVIKNGFKWQSN